MERTQIIHITTGGAWSAALSAGEYRPHSLEEEGFIHCSTPEQVLDVANALFRDEEGLVLLVIDPGRVAAAIRYEDCYQSGQAFPHIYGPLPAAAVTAVYDFPPGPGGRFALPDDLAN